MSSAAFDFCLRVNQAHASLRLKLDDELGTLHGLSLDDFILLRSLSQAGDAGLAVADLMRPLGVTRSAVVRQIVPLEKTGLVQRQATAPASRRVVLRPAGQRLLGEAATTARSVCEEAVWSLPAGTLLAADCALAALSQADALRP